MTTYYQIKDRYFADAQVDEAVNSILRQILARSLGKGPLPAMKFLLSLSGEFCHGVWSRALRDLYASGKGIPKAEISSGCKIFKCLRDIT
jgi:hypothetical protein